MVMSSPEAMYRCLPSFLGSLRFPRSRLPAATILVGLPHMARDPVVRARDQVVSHPQVGRRRLLGGWQVVATTG